MELTKFLSIGILAAGKSTRMGRNKAFLNIYNETFLQRLSSEFKEFEDLLISVDKKSKYGDYLDKLIEDEHINIGPMEGIYQVLAHAKNEFVFICGVDMPFLKKELVLYMVEYISSDFDCYIITDDSGIHPLCGIYSKKILSVIKELIDNKEYRLKGIFKRVRTKYVSLENSRFTSKLIQNINTEIEYRNHITSNIFCVSGVKNSGKTTLIEKLICEFNKDGKNVSVIKHDGHDFHIDIEGTDTYRYVKAGASKIGIFSDYQNAIIEKKNSTSLSEMIEKMNAVDIVIIEGMKDCSYPKIEVMRSAISKGIVCDPKTIICIATDNEICESYGKPIFDMNDIVTIYTFIKEKLTS